MPAATFISARPQTTTFSFARWAWVISSKGRVPGDPRQDADASLLQEGLHEPEVAGDIVFSDQIDIAVRRDRGFARADDLIEQHLSGDAVPQVLGPRKSRRAHRDDPDAEIRLGLSAHRLEILADQAAHAGRVDEDGLRLDRLMRPHDGVMELLVRRRTRYRSRPCPW